jgi:hypothetical protein
MSRLNRSSSPRAIGAPFRRFATPIAALSCGLAQRAKLETFVKLEGLEIVQDFVEVETGKGADADMRACCKV